MYVERDLRKIDKLIQKEQNINLSLLFIINYILDSRLKRVREKNCNSRVVRYFSTHQWWRFDYRSLKPKFNFVVVVHATGNMYDELTDSGGPDPKIRRKGLSMYL